VLKDATAILVNLPDRSLGVGTLHGSVEFGLLGGQAEAEDDVWHSRFQKVERRPAGFGWPDYRAGACPPGDVVHFG
jgi:hypothetical protein